MARIIFLLCCFLICIIQAEANEDHEIPKITFRVKDQPLDSLLNKLEKQSGYSFFYQNKIVSKPNEIIHFTLSAVRNFENKTVSEILDLLLEKRGFSSFVLDECKVAFIYRKYERVEIPKITIRFENQSLDSALNELKQQSGYRFFYQDKIVGTQVKINQEFEDKTVSEILGILLGNTNYNYVDFYKRSKVAVIYKEKENKQSALPFSVTGKVIDEAGNTVLGASVYIKREDTLETGTLTNEDGIFTITTNNPDSYIIVRYIGYIPRVVHIKDAALIKLEPDEEMLNKVIFF